jgi:hypothetical protein
MGYPFLGEIPLNPIIRKRSDSGQPLGVETEETAIGLSFRDIACATAAQVSIVNYNAPLSPIIE